VKGRERARLAALVRGQGFLDKFADRVAEVNKAGVRRELDACVRDVERRAAIQVRMRDRAAVQAERKQRLREVLRLKHIGPLVPIAQATYRPGPSDLRRLTLPWRRVSDAKLVTAAAAIANVVEKHPARLLEERLPVTFVGELRAAAAAVERARLEGWAARGERHVATVGIRISLARGRRALTVPRTLLVRKLGRKSSLIRVWDSETRVRRKPGRKRKRRTE